MHVDRYLRWYHVCSGALGLKLYTGLTHGPFEEGILLEKLGSSRAGLFNLNDVRNIGGTTAFAALVRWPSCARHAVS